MSHSPPRSLSLPIPPPLRPLVWALALLAGVTVLAPVLAWLRVRLGAMPPGSFGDPRLIAASMGGLLKPLGLALLLVWLWRVRMRTGASWGRLWGVVAPERPDGARGERSPPPRRLGSAATGALLRGILWGLATLGLLVAALLLLGVRSPLPGLEAADLGRALVRALVVATLVATLEEIWFRGGLVALGGEGRGGAAAATLVWVAGHYLRFEVSGSPPAGLAPVEGSGPEAWLGAWSSALTLLGQSLAGLPARAHPGDVAALLAAGAWLAAWRLRSGHVWGAFGLHFAWVLVIQSARRTTRVETGEPYAWLVGPWDGIIGWGGAVTLAAGFLAWWLSGRLRPVR